MTVKLYYKTLQDKNLRQNSGGLTGLLLCTVNFPNDVGAALIDFPPRRMSSCAFPLRFWIDQRTPRISRGRVPRASRIRIRTTCSSHESPSVMYLKHLSHTHKVDFSPVPWLLPNPPASKSDVRPCERTVDRLTPGMRVDDNGAPGGPTEEVEGGSSISVSMRG